MPTYETRQQDTTRGKCRDCTRTYAMRTTTIRLADLCDHPLAVKELIQPLAREFDTLAVQAYICPDCVDDRWTKILADNSSPDGHIVSETDEYFGRWDQEVDGMPTVVTRSAAVIAGMAIAGGVGRKNGKTTQAQQKAKSAQGAGQVVFIACHPDQQSRVQMVKGDYKNKLGTVIGSVSKGYWEGIRVRLDSGKEIDVQATSVEVQR